MANQNLEFWHTNLGRHLSSAAMEASAKALVPTRMGKEGAENGKGARVAPNALGAMIDAYYIVTPGHSWLLGRVAMTNTDGVTFVATDGPEPTNAARFIGRWLMEDAVAPFMVGVIGNANPNSSFRISEHTARSAFCENGGGFVFNLDDVRADVAMLGRETSWRSVAEAMWIYQDARLADKSTVAGAAALERQRKLLSKSPEFRSLLPKLRARPGSGEARVLSWILPA